ncbi:MAG: ABC transporter permease [Pseudomonadota bacterium]
MELFVAQVLTGLANASSLFLVACGLSLIFGVTRIVNFAHGSFYMLGAYLAYTLIETLPGVVGFWAAIVIAAVVIGLLGALVELVVLRPVYRAPELFQLVATFGVILIVQDLALMIWGPEDLLGPRAPGLRGVVRVMGEPIPKYDIALLVITPAVALGLWYVMTRTRIGVLLRAATQDREMVGALGVNQAWLFTGVFAVGTGLAALGGALQLPRGGADLFMDFTILAPVFVVVVIGGMGSLPGAYLAAIIISVLRVFGITYVPESTLVLMYVVMVAVLMVRPYGLFGREEVAGEHGQVGEPQRPLTPASMPVRLAIGAAILGLALLPIYGSSFAVVLATDIVIFCLFAASLHFLLGLGGLVSFGHAAYYGGGAYVAALLVTHADSPMELAFLLAPIGAGVAALAIGWVCLRLTGVYFAMLTLAFAQLIWSLVFQWGSVTGGDDGLLGIWPAGWLNDTVAYFYFALIFGIGGILVLRHVAHTPFGYALRAARDSQRQAEATGIDTRRVQLAAFGFAGFMGGLAGALFVFSKGSVFPNELEIARSFDALIVVFLGGVQTLSGGVVGAGFFKGIEDFLTRFDYWRLVMGLLIVVVVVLAPHGIVGSLRKGAERVGILRTEAAR